MFVYGARSVSRNDPPHRRAAEWYLAEGTEAENDLEALLAGICPWPDGVTQILMTLIGWDPRSF